MKKPIVTAPRDGTNILIFFGQDGVSQAKYIPGPPYPWQFIDTNDGVTWLINHAVDGPGGPSHWMPLPSYATQPTENAAVQVDNKLSFTLTDSEIDDMIFGYAPNCPIGEGRELLQVVLSMANKKWNKQ